MKHLGRISGMVLGVMLVLSPLQAGTKEDIIRLQGDLQAVQNQLRALQKSIDENGAISKTLLNQLIDSTAKSARNIEDMKQTVDAQSKTGTDSVEDMLNEVRAVGAKVDDLVMKVSVLSKKLEATQSALDDMKNRRPTAGTAPDGKPLPLPADQLYNLAYNDYIQGNFELSIQGFIDFLANYKDSEYADNAQYYIGDCFFNQNKYKESVDAFTKAIADYPKGDKIPAAYLKRGLARLNLKENDAAIEDFKGVYLKFPDVPEANIAVQQMQILGVTPPARVRRK